MDLIDGMKAFSQVVSTGSFTKAGDRLGISKKLVSKYVAQLEDRLGVRLLNRTTRSLSLTEAGSLYFERCVELLDDLEELEQTVQSENSSPKGRLYITAPVTFGEMYITPLISSFREKYRDVTIELQLNDRTVNLVEEGFDIAIRIGALKNSSLIARKLCPARVVVCASQAYLDTAGVPEHPDDLVQHDIIVDTNFRSESNWPFIIDGTEISRPLTPCIKVNSARSAHDLAIQGRGITLCPKYVAYEAIQSGELVELLSDFTSVRSDLYAVYSSRRNLVPKVRAFVDFLHKELQAFTQKL